MSKERDTYMTRADDPGSNEARVNLLEYIIADIKAGVLKESTIVHSRLRPLDNHIGRYQSATPELHATFKKLIETCEEFGIWPKI